MDIRFTIEYFTRWGESLSIVAEDVKYPMHWEGEGVWSVTVPDCGPDFLKDYSYAVIEDGIIVRTEWEHHSARKAKVIRDEWKSCPIPGCPFPRRHSAEIFDRPGFRGAGTAAPVFSLRTRNDFGTGEFNDLVPLIDWAAATGQCIIQLLPVNDTTRRGEWGDSYPYSPASSFALHPLYINLQDIGVKADAAFRKLQSELNAFEELDYPRVFREKSGKAGHFTRHPVSARGHRGRRASRQGPFPSRPEESRNVPAADCSGFREVAIPAEREVRSYV